MTTDTDRFRIGREPHMSTDEKDGKMQDTTLDKPLDSRSWAEERIAADVRALSGVATTLKSGDTAETPPDKPMRFYRVEVFDGGGVRTRAIYGLRGSPDEVEKLLREATQRSDGIRLLDDVIPPVKIACTWLTNGRVLYRDVTAGRDLSTDDEESLT